MVYILSRREGEIHAELYRHLQNVIETRIRESESGERERAWFSRCSSEVRAGEGEADLVVYDERDRPIVVIEAKRQSRGQITRDIDPFSPQVMRQAHGYSAELGTPFFATYNGKHCVLFERSVRFVPLTELNSRPLRVTNVELFAEDFLNVVEGFLTRSMTWSSVGEKLIARLIELHRQMWPLVLQELLDKLSANDFSQQFESWVKLNGWDYEKARTKAHVHINFSQQAAYLLMNKLFFYRILQSEPRYSTLRSLAWDGEDTLSRIYQRFQTVKDEIDFEAIYDHDPIFDLLDYSNLIDIVQEFTEEIEEYSLWDFDSDIVGQIYQSVIPPQVKHDLGEYYTPPEVAELIVRYCIRSPNDKLLDPACGSGGFLVKAYDWIHQLSQDTGANLTHNQILDRICGIDINRFPAHLTAINLAIRNLASPTEHLNIIVSDFFHVNPGQETFAVVRGSPRGDNETTERSHEPCIYSKVDVVIANPPYIRQELIPDKSHVRRHLESRQWSRENWSGRISERSDIYTYFFTHALEFLGPLDESGRIGYLTSERWLDAGYGVGLQEFLLNYFRIEAIVSFDRQLFGDALIDTIVVLLSKDSNPETRDSNSVRFVRIMKDMSLDDIITLIRIRNFEPESVTTAEKWQVTTKNQASLQSERKWRRFIHAPPIYWEILRSGMLTSLSELANVRFGLKTGANSFFYKKRNEIIELGLQDYFVPLIKSVGQLDYNQFLVDDTEWTVLDVHSLVQDAKASLSQEGFTSDRLVESIKRILNLNNHESLVRYIEWGETKGYDSRPSIRRREVWFDLGELPRAPYVFPKEMWKKNIVYNNQDEIANDQHLYYLVPNDDVDPVTLHGVLISSLGGIMRDLHSRIASGEALNRVESTVNDVNNLPIIDVRRFGDAELTRIRNAVELLLRRERDLIPRKSEGTLYETSEMSEPERTRRLEYIEIRRELDRAVMAAINMEERTPEIEEAFLHLLDIRIKRGGIGARTLVQTEHRRPRVIHLRGSILEGENQTRLTDF